MSTPTTCQVNSVTGSGGVKSMICSLQQIAVPPATPAHLFPHQSGAPKNGATASTIAFRELRTQEVW